MFIVEKESGARAVRTLCSHRPIAISSKNVFPGERCASVSPTIVGQRYRGTIERETRMNNRWLSVTGARRVADRSPR